MENFTKSSIILKELLAENENKVIYEFFVIKERYYVVKIFKTSTIHSVMSRKFIIGQEIKNIKGNPLYKIINFII